MQEYCDASQTRLCLNSDLNEKKVESPTLSLNTTPYSDPNVCKSNEECLREGDWYIYAKLIMVDMLENWNNNNILLMLMKIHLKRFSSFSLCYYKHFHPTLSHILSCFTTMHKLTQKKQTNKQTNDRDGNGKTRMFYIITIYCLLILFFFFFF